MGIRDNMDQLSGNHPADLGQHMHQHRVLYHVPVICRKHILGTLVQHRVQYKLLLSLLLGHVEGHAVGARIQPHPAQIGMNIHIGHDPPAEGVVLKVVDHPVHLVKLSLGIAVLHPHLVAVGPSDRALLIGPGIPDMRA